MVRWLVTVAACALASLWVRAAAAEPRCTPVTRVSGEPALVERIVALLVARGLAVSGESACGEVTAVVAADGERVRLVTMDADGRRVEQIADDPQAAATAIESWARTDLADPLLAPRAAPPPPSQVSDREAAPVASVETSPPGPARRAATSQLAVGVETGFSSDDAMWYGARVQGCYAIGRVCIGALVSYAVDRRCCGDSRELSTERESFDLLAAVAVPFERGAWGLSPQLAIGQRWMLADRERSDGEVTADTSTPHLRADLAGRVRVSGDWFVHVDLAVGGSPLGRRGLGTVEPQLAGVPRVQGWLGLGVGYGGL